MQFPTWRNAAHPSPSHPWPRGALLARRKAATPELCSGTVTDPSGAVVPNATVHLSNPVSEFAQTTTTDATGQFTFSNVPFNPYPISVSAKGFARLSQNVEIRSSVGIKPQAGSAGLRRQPNRHGRVRAAT